MIQLELHNVRTFLKLLKRCENVNLAFSGAVLVVVIGAALQEIMGSKTDQNT